MIPALGAGGPGFKSRFGPCFFTFKTLNIMIYLMDEKCFYQFLEQKLFPIRGHSELNQGPAGLQPDALPLSYIPFSNKEAKRFHYILL